MNVTVASKGGQQPITPAWLSSAYSAIDAGYAVFLLQGKVPLKGFQWREHATRDKAQIYQWSLENPAITAYGIALGAEDLVLDSDPRNFPQGRNIESELLGKYAEQFRLTQIVKTPGGGHHVYLKKDPEKRYKKNQSTYPGVDFMSDGSYVVGSGSCTASGEYRLLVASTNIQCAPDELLAVLEVQSDAIVIGTGETLAYQPQFVVECQTSAPAIQGQWGDKTTLDMAHRGRDLGLPLETVFQVMRDHFNPRCQPMWEEHDLYEKCQNAFKYAKGAAGQKTPDAVFAQFALTEPPAQVVSAVGEDNKKSDDTSEKAAKQKKTQAKILLDSASKLLLWNDSGTACATAQSGKHFESFRLPSDEADKFLSYGYYKLTGNAPSESALKEVSRTLSAKAYYEGPEYKSELRVSMHDGSIWVYLHNQDRQQIRIGIDGYEVIDSGRSPVKFLSFLAMQSLPLPVAAGSEAFSKLKALLGLDQSSFIRLLAFVMGCYRSDIPTPLLMISAEQGSGKSFLSKVIQRLVDPSADELKSPPETERDFCVSMVNGYLQPFDNTTASRLPKGFGDSICRAVTGGTFTKRANYSDDREKSLRMRHKKIILNGINEASTQEDVLDRTLLVNLPVIPEGRRRTEASLWEEFESIYPELMGAIFAAISGALRRLPETKLETLPRMADFALWMAAAEPDLGLMPGEFESCYKANRREADELILEFSPFGRWVLNDLPLPYEDSASALLTQMKFKLGMERSLPGSARALSAYLKRLAPQLRRLGVEVSWPQRRSDKRLVRIERDDPFLKLL
ncbi:MAG: hypothetical protein C0508_01225 [Cyanobacteria bacterium PR.023]|nr:hypothetical protein [Cyanobacteria bacterium PR.3.49]MBA4073629.1 hypothetical protein [Cyanobacteria bacterium PR.023]